MGMRPGSTLRWRIARWLVGPIIRDPLEGDGCAIIIREGGATATFLPTKFRLRSRVRLHPRMYGLYGSYDPDRTFGDTHRTRTTFVGTIER